MKKYPENYTSYMKKNGRITKKLERSLEGVLRSYVETVKFWAEKREKPLEDYIIREAYIVGSILRGNNLSDIDFLLIANKIDQEDYRFIKHVMANEFFVNRPKTEAIDVYVRPYDEFPERGSYEITDQVEAMLNRYNKKLSDSEKIVKVS